MVSATLGIAITIITESALSFLGLGRRFPTWSPSLRRCQLHDFDTLAGDLAGLAISLTVLMSTIWVTGW